MTRSIGIAVVLIIILCSTPTVVTAAQHECAERSDPAAMALSNRDTALTDFVHIGAFDESLQAESAIMASYLGFTQSPVEMRDFLAEQGWQRKYFSRIGKPIVDLPGRYSQVVHSYVTEYCDAAGAATAFAVLEDESNAENAEDSAPARQFGDETDLTQDEGIDAESHQFQSLDLSFRVGSRVGGVTLVVYPTAEGADPEQEYLEELATILEERMLQPPEPGPGYSLARLDPVETVTFDDAYYRYNGGDISIVDESEASAEVRTAGYLNAEAVYQLFQDVQSLSGRSVLYSLTVYEFDSESDAALWLDDAQDLIETNAYYARLEELEIEGEASRAFRFTPFGNVDNALIVLTQTGDTIHRIQLVPTVAAPEVTLAVGEELMQEQLACFTSGTCISIALPDSLIDLIDAPPASPSA